LGLKVEAKSRDPTRERTHSIPSHLGNVRGGSNGPSKHGTREFVKAFKRRNVSSDPLAMFTIMAGQQEAGELPPPPAPCQSCYKMLGI
jgi:hypothetical protein